jgi:hypothetical protein
MDKSVDPVAILLPSEGPAASVAIHWATQELARALRLRDIEVALEEKAGAVTIRLAIGDDASADRAAAAASATLPESAESLALLPIPDGVLAWGGTSGALFML